MELLQVIKHNFCFLNTYFLFSHHPNPTGNVVFKILDSITLGGKVNPDDDAVHVTA